MLIQVLCNDCEFGSGTCYFISCISSSHVQPRIELIFLHLYCCCACVKYDNTLWDIVCESTALSPKVKVGIAVYGIIIDTSAIKLSLGPTANLHAIRNEIHFLCFSKKLVIQSRCHLLSAPAGATCLPLLCHTVFTSLDRLVCFQWVSKQCCVSHLFMRENQQLSRTFRALWMIISEASPGI